MRVWLYSRRHPPSFLPLLSYIYNGHNFLGWSKWRCLTTFPRLQGRTHFMLPQNFFVIQSMTRTRQNCVEVFTYYCRASQIEYFVRMSLVSVFLGAYLLPARRKGNHSAFHFLCQFSSWIQWYWAILPLFLWFIEYY